MSYWIEVRCHKQWAVECYSARMIDTPMTLTNNGSLASINKAIFNLTEEAKKLGWTLTKEGWVCPKCHE